MKVSSITRRLGEGEFHNSAFSRGPHGASSSAHPHVCSRPPVNLLGWSQGTSPLAWLCAELGASGRGQVAFKQKRMFIQWCYISYVSSFSAETTGILLVSFLFLCTKCLGILRYSKEFVARVFPGSLRSARLRNLFILRVCATYVTWSLPPTP